MKTKLLLLPIGLLAAACNLSDTPRPTTEVLKSVVGRYRGRLYYSAFRYGQPAIPGWQRDTTIEVVALNGDAVQLLGSRATYVPGTLNQSWGGHAPQRRNYYFRDEQAGSNYTHLQAELNGDSIYLESSSGSLGGASTYHYYAKKLL